MKWYKDIFYVYCVMLCINKVIALVNFILRSTIGYDTIYSWNGEKQESLNKYEKSAHVVDVWFKASPSILPTLPDISLKYFIVTHNSYTHPSYLLSKDNIILHGVTPTHAIFSEVDSGRDVYDLKITPFAFIDQFYSSKKLILIPHEAFNKLADSIGDPINTDVILLTNSARCGSTLLCQMMSHLPGTRVMSEPLGFITAHWLYTMDKIGKGTYKKLVQSLVRLVCKKEHERTSYDRVVIKLPYLSCPIVSIINEVCPYVQHVFSLRMPKPSILSMYKVMHFTSIDSTFIRYKYMHDLWMSTIPLPYETHEWLSKKYYHDRHSMTVVDCLAAAYAGAITSFLEQKPIYKRAILYDDLAENSLAVTEDLFKALGIPVEQAHLALKGLEDHSQQNMFGQKQFEIKEHQWEQVDAIFKEVGIPLHKDSTREDMKKLILS